MLRESNLALDDESPPEHAQITQLSIQVAEERTIPPTPDRMPMPAADRAKARKKEKKKEKAFKKRSHSKSLSRSPKRRRKENGESSAPLADALMSKAMRVSKKIKFHISNEEKVAFRNSTLEELIDAFAEFAGRNLLIATRMRNEMPKYFSSDEANKLRKNLDISNKDLEETRSSLQTYLRRMRTYPTN